jgi:prophage regulatory protein
MQGHSNICPVGVDTRPSGDDDGRLLRLDEVLDRVGMSKAWVYLGMSQGRFPKPLRLGMRAVAWRARDVQAWQGGLQVVMTK